jgi:hypothetical protein
MSNVIFLDYMAGALKGLCKFCVCLFRYIYYEKEDIYLVIYVIGCIIKLMHCFLFKFQAGLITWWLSVCDQLQQQ